MAQDIRAGRAFVELFLKDKLFFANLAGSLAKAGTKAAAIGASVSAGIGAGLGGLVIAFANTGAELGKLSLQTGATVEDLSRMRFAARRLRVDQDDLTGAIEELNIRLGETLRDGIGPAAEAFDQLGLDAAKLANMPLPERLGMIADALNGISSQATRGFLADEIFGGDAFKILPILRQGSEGIRELAESSDALGATLNSGQIENAKRLGAAWSQIKETTKAAGIQLGAALAPAAADVAQVVSKLVQETGKWVQENGGLVNVLADLSERLFAFLPLGDGFRNAFTAFSETWASIVDAVKSGDLELAAQIAWAGLEVVWRNGTQSLNELWISAKFFALETWLSFKTEAAQIFVAMFASAESAWVRTVGFIESTWSKLTTTLKKGWQQAQLGIGDLIISAAENSGAISSEFASVWRETLDNQLGGQIDQTTREGARQQAEIEARMRNRISQIETDAGGAIASLEEDRQRALEALDSSSESERLAAAQALLDAEQRLADLRAKVRTEDAEGEAAAGAGGALAKTKSEVFGTFSAAAAAAQGAGGGDSVAKNTHELRRLAIEEARRQEKIKVATEKMAEGFTGLGIRFI